MNARGLKDGIKPSQLVDHMEAQEIQILGIAETNFTEEDHRHRIPAHSRYRSYWANGESRGEGVGIMIDREIDKHNTKIRRYGGRIITVELLFKDKVKLGIAQVYFPSDKTKRTEWEGKLRRIVQQWESSNTHSIVMGDFNAVVDPRKDRKGGTSSRAESEIFRDMKESNLRDSFRVFNRGQRQYTWEGRNLGSRIDMIWTSEGITGDTQHAEIVDFRDEMSTDHKQPRISIDPNRFARTKCKIREHRSIGPYDLKKLKEEDWKRWGEDLDEYINDNHTLSSTLEEKWKVLEKAMKKAADRHFTRIKFKNNRGGGKKDHKPTPLYVQYRKLNRLIELVGKLQEKRLEETSR